MNPYKPGDRVQYKDEIEREGKANADIFYVYDMYSDTEVSLSIRGRKYHEQDYLTDINEITPA